MFKGYSSHSMCVCLSDKPAATYMYRYTGLNNVVYMYYYYYNFLEDECVCGTDIPTDGPTNRTVNVTTEGPPDPGTSHAANNTTEGPPDLVTTKSGI